MVIEAGAMLTCSISLWKKIPFETIPGTESAHTLILARAYQLVSDESEKAVDILKQKSEMHHSGQPRTCAVSSTVDPRCRQPDFCR